MSEKMVLKSIPADEFVPDPPQESIAKPSGGPALASIPADQFIPDRIKYSTPTQTAIGTAEAFARGATYNLSDAAEVGLGLSTPEAIKGRQRELPGAAEFLATAAGGIAPAVLTGGVAPAANLALRGAAEGLAYGAGSLISDKVLGDTDLNAQKIITNLGFSTLTGGATGAVFGAAPALFRKVFGKAAKEIPGEVAATEGVLGNTISDAPFSKVAPDSMDEIAERVAKAKAQGMNLDLPQKAIIEDVSSRLDMGDVPFHKIQLDSLNSQKARDLYSLSRELPGKDQGVINAYEAAQKNVLNHTIESEIKKLSPQVEPTSDIMKAADRFKEVVSEKYQSTKKNLSPKFEALKKMDLGEGSSHVPGVIQSMVSAVPDAAQMFDTQGGKFAIKEFSDRWELDEAAYDAIKKVINDLKNNNEPLTVKGLLGLREGMKSKIDVLSQGKGPAQIRALGKSLIDYVQESSKNPEIREILRGWAINENDRDLAEKLFKSSVGNLNLSGRTKGNAQEVLNTIFKKPENVIDARKLLGQEKLDEMTANYLASAKEGFTTEGVFSSKRFDNFLKDESPALSEALSHRPDVLQKLNDAATAIRIIPDKSPNNPSGTVKTAVGYLNKMMDLISHPSAIPGKALKGAIELFKENEERRAVNDALAGVADRTAKLKAVESMAKKVTDNINHSAKSLFDAGTLSRGATAAFVNLTKSEYLDKTNKIKELASNPELLMKQSSDHVAGLSDAAPNIAQGMQTTMASAISYLNSKIPAQKSGLLLSQPKDPSREQIHAFNQAYHVISNPLSVFQEIKQGVLSGASLEALSVVHPKLLDEMRTQTMSHLTPEKAMALSYTTKMSLAKFLGQPLDESMLPETIVANQASLTQPSQSSQSTPSRGRKPALGALKNIKASDRRATLPNRDDE